MPAKDNIVSNWITFPSNEYEMPEVGDLVRVEFEPARYGNAYVSGICCGKYFNKDTLPQLQGKDIFYKEMLGDVTLIYDRAKKQLTIQTDKEIILKAVEKLEIQTKQLLIDAEQVEVTAQTVQISGATVAMSGQTSINGETSIIGNLTVSGTVSAENI
nr:MAG TPA: baseplate assembly protein [Caudoviricetes sp.]